jgi:hypothetical protein
VLNVLEIIPVRLAAAQFYAGFKNTPRDCFFFRPHNLERNGYKWNLRYSTKEMDINGI